jgi:hypothetical protein
MLLGVAFLSIERFLRGVGFIAHLAGDRGCIGKIAGCNLVLYFAEFRIRQSRQNFRFPHRIRLFLEAGPQFRHPILVHGRTRYQDNR